MLPKCLVKSSQDGDVKAREKGWRDGSAVPSTGYSSRAPGVHLPAPTWQLQASSSIGSNPSHTHIHVGKTWMHIKKNLKKKQVEIVQKSSVPYNLPTPTLFPGDESGTPWGRPRTTRLRLPRGESDQGLPTEHSREEEWGAQDINNLLSLPTVWKPQVSGIE